MNLLPKFHEEFAQTNYWNEFFKKRGVKAFEWYGEYFELAEIVNKYIRKSENILMVGCGNSKLGMDMYDVGFKSITNVDISSVVITQMLDLNKNIRDDLKFLQMDATNMSFDDESFSVAFDKGTLDALFVNESMETQDKVESYLNEVVRVLRTGGRYLCVSLLQHHILKYLLNYFSNKSFIIRIVYCHSLSISDGHDGMPVFVIVATKMKSSIPFQVLEYSQSKDHTQRVQTIQELTDFVLSIQNAAFVCKGLKKDNLSGLNSIKLELVVQESESPRYTVHVIDQRPRRGLEKYAAFIVPQGRETDWMFSTDKGRKKLLESVNYERLAIVLLHPDQEYKTIDAVKAELTECIQKLAPHGTNQRIPFLSLGSDIGKRTTLFSGSSNISGDYRIEEIENEDGQIFRRLIFSSNQFVIQSEASLTTNNDCKQIDLQHLACQHHEFMSLAAEIAVHNDNSIQKQILVIGLGGGGLCSFLHSVLPNVLLTAVDIDPVMLQISEEYFGLKPDDKLQVYIEDGIEFLKENASEGNYFDAVLLDVDSKNSSVGLSCPPKVFLEMSTLQNIRNIIGLDGILILNLVCRESELRDSIITDLRAVFTSLCAYKLEEDVNEIIFCTNNTNFTSKKKWSDAFKNAESVLNAAIIDKTNSLSAANLLKDLEIL